MAQTMWSVAGIRHRADWPGKKTPAGLPGCVQLQGGSFMARSMQRRESGLGEYYTAGAPRTQKSAATRPRDQDDQQENARASAECPNGSDEAAERFAGRGRGSRAMVRSTACEQRRGGKLEAAGLLDSERVSWALITSCGMTGPGTPA
ncbi:hypothetical protein NDU88_009060 [Pleurodeles waltl]|uniref:Uncharacterized protein n=1 Tax=Pleurodeles waltl TaxID=8319 RepID=A0AAV7RU73_PLEWA|nr:hypothetical protein NDU88_009060 [Pleurodeles waltl]